MKIFPLKGFRTAAGVRTMGQFVALVLVPLGAFAGWLQYHAQLTPLLVQQLELIALACVVVAVLAAIVQGEINARRLDRLIESTRRMARQDFSVAVPVSGRDQVSELSRAVNEMAQNLGANLSAQGLLAQMDDAIMTKLDVGALIRSALRCMRLATLAEFAVVGLFDAETPEEMRIFSLRKGERNRVDSQKLLINAELKRRIPLAPARKTATQSPFPADFEERLRSELGVGHFFAMPISRGGRAWGVMVLCHQNEAELNANQVKILAGVANRLVAGLSGAERDEKMQSLAFVDPLTGLPNRVAVPALVTQQLAIAAKSSTLSGILYVDLDRFKQANDTHGHAFGDRLLVQAANRVRNHVREDDVVARIGGDEFCVILPDLRDPREAASVARKLIQSLSRRFEIDGHTIYTGASVGVAMFPEDGTDGNDLVKMAEAAMYRAKSAGRGRFAFYEEPEDGESERRTVIDAELRNAIERNELLLHYQPQIDLRTGALCGVEALVRWQHPTRGLLYPNDFIAYADEIGLSPEIGAWVVKAACEQYQRWREEGVRVPRVAINIANGQLPTEDFVSTLSHYIESARMPHDALEVEVTESMLVEGGKAALDALNELAALGVTVAIDDFGTGYSSFTHLKSLPARVLKLDMSFLVDARVDNDAGKIVAAIINMAHALQKEVVAEGVELVEQLKLLKTLGCERGQGYLFGKAVDAEYISRTFRKIAGEAPASAAQLPPRAAVPTMSLAIAPDAPALPAASAADSAPAAAALAPDAGPRLELVADEPEFTLAAHSAPAPHGITHGPTSAPAPAGGRTIDPVNLAALLGVNGTTPAAPAPAPATPAPAAVAGLAPVPAPVAGLVPVPAPAASHAAVQAAAATPEHPVVEEIAVDTWPHGFGPTVPLEEEPPKSGQLEGLPGVSAKATTLQ